MSLQCTHGQSAHFLISRFAFENSDEDCGHSQKSTSEGEAGHAKQQEEGCDLRDTMQRLPLYVHWSDRENLGETPKRTQGSGKEE